MESNRDKLTGLFKRENFLQKCDTLISEKSAGYYIMSCLDVDNFKVINDQYSMSVGNQVLKYIADCLFECTQKFDGLACRFTADRFAFFYPAKYKDSQEIFALHKAITAPNCINRSIRIRIGRYYVTDTSLSSEVMFEHAIMAEETLKGRYDIYIAEYDDSMRNKLLREQEIVNDMDHAMQNHEFIPFFQPQYNHATGALLGAEALVRWKKDYSFISPGEFIPIFEKNGFVYEVDKCIWEQVCALLHQWMEAGKNPLPVSVNISRFDLYKEDFFETICELVKKYKIPTDLLRLEVTESAFADSPKTILDMVNQLITYGFTVEIDDFGSGYSSLNTLKDVPASILKLDMKFFSKTNNSERSGNIVESIVRMAKWLGMAVIAEGVEEKEQADFLKSIGCYYIQGYFYARPMSTEEYVKLLSSDNREPKLTRLHSLATLDNDEFWNPKSMDTLIFNSYVGGACVFELYKGHIELMRVNDQYRAEMGKTLPANSTFQDMNPIQHADEVNKVIFNKTLNKVIKTRQEASCELALMSITHRHEYIKFTMRIIASTDERLLFYCIVHNMTKQRNEEKSHLEAKRKKAIYSEQLHAIMKNVNGGVSAFYMTETGKFHFVMTNEKYHALYGYTKEDAKKNAFNVMSLILPEDRPTIMKQLEQLRKDGKPVTIDYRCRKKNGDIAYLRAESSLMKLEGYAEHIVASVITDITELREAELRERIVSDKMKALLTHAGNGITSIILHKDSNELILANDKYYKIIGYSKKEYEKIFHEDVFSVVHPLDRERVMKEAYYTNNNHSETTIEYRVIRKDKSVIWIKNNITVTKLYGIDDPVQIAVFTDITKEKESNELLTFLNDTTHAILEKPSIDSSLNETIQRMMNYFDADRSYIIEFDDENQVANNTYEVCKEGIEAEIGVLQHIPYKEFSYVLDILKKKEIVYIKEVSKLGKNKKSVKEILSMQGIHSIISAPLMRGGKMIGMIGVDNPQKYIEQASRLMAIGDYVTEILSNRDLQKKIEEDNNTIRTLMDDTPGGFCELKLFMDRLPEIVYINRGLCELTGMTKDEVWEHFSKDINELLHPTDAKQTKLLYDKLRDCGEEFSIKVRLLTKSGKYKWVMLFARVTIVAGKSKYLNLYFADIERQVKEEQRQKELLENLPCGIGLFEFDGKKIDILHLNKRYWQLVDRNPDKEKKDAVTKAVHPDDFFSLAGELGEAIIEKRDFSCDIRIKYGEKGYRPFHIAAAYVSEKKGKYSFYATATPIDKHVMSFQEMLPIALSTMMKASGDMSYMKDRRLHYICCSQSMADTIGLPDAQQIRGLTDYDLFDKEMAEAFQQDDLEIIRTGKPNINNSDKIPDKNGSLIYVVTSKYPLIDNNGNAIGIYGISRNVMEAHEKETRLELLIRSIPGGLASFAITNGIMKIMFMNEGFFSLLGYTREEYVNLTKDELLATIVEEDRSIVREAVFASKTHSEGEDIKECEYRCQTKDGRIKWMNLKGRYTKISNTQYILNIVKVDITLKRQDQERIRLAEEEYRYTAKHSGRTIGRYVIDKRTLTISAEEAKRFQLPEVLENVPYGEDIIGRISEDTKKTYLEFYESILQGKAEGTATFQKLLPNGWRWLNALYSTIYNTEGKPISAIISFIDVTDQYEKEAIYRKWQQSMEERSKASYSLYKMVLLPNFSVDEKEGKLIHFPRECKDMSYDECTTYYAERYIRPESRQMILDNLKKDELIKHFYEGKRNRVFEYQDNYSGEYKWFRLTVDLIERPDDRGVIAYFMFENIDESKKAELNIQTMAETDALTGLLNRKAFEDRLTAKLAERENNSLFAFCVLDMDGFKQVNDTFGHYSGDQILIKAGQTLHSALHECDLVGRLGGDEFIICMCNVPSQDIIRKTVRRIWKLLHYDMGQNVQVTASIGIAVCPEDGADFISLYHKADKALYRIKENGKNNYGFYRGDEE